MAKGDKALVTSTMKLGRETKGTHVYKDEGDDPAIPSLYIRKSAMKDPPNSITVTISAA